jgi:hypothetical protein
MVFFEQFQQHVLCVFVWNVSNHYRCSSIQLNLLDVNHIGSGFFITDSSSISTCRCLSHIIIIIFWKHLDHHWHHRYRHRVGGVGARKRSITSRNGIGTMLGILSNNSHAGIHNLINHLIFLITFWRISRPISL